MDIVSYYFITTEQLTKGISIPPDVYKYIEHDPRHVTIIIRGENDAPLPLNGGVLLKRIGEGEICIYAESYRLVENTELVVQ